MKKSSEKNRSNSRAAANTGNSVSQAVSQLNADEELQGKFETSQLNADEELQGKFKTSQLNADEELQGKFETSQLNADEELQGKFETSQLNADEELQGKFETSQLNADEELQGKFETSQLNADEELQGKFKTTQLKADENQTGMSDNLKSGIESLSGVDVSDVRVHYNSSKPAQMNAHAYAQGTNIHVSPGQEQHVPHEAWHTVQQKQGRVQPTTAVNGTPVNDNVSLETEADVMGAKAAQFKG